VGGGDLDADIFLNDAGIGGFRKNLRRFNS